MLFLAEAARFTDLTSRRKFRSKNRFLRNFSHENLNCCPDRIDCLVDYTRDYIVVRIVLEYERKPVSL